MRLSRRILKEVPRLFRATMRKVGTREGSEVLKNYLETKSICMSI